MKFPAFALPLSLFGAAAFHVANAQVTSVFSDTFDTYAPGNADSAYVAAYNGVTTNYTVSSGTGLGGSQSVQNTADATIIRKDSAIDFTTGGVDAFVAVSVYFQYAGSGGIAGPQVGLVTAGNGNFTGTGDVSGRLSSNSLQLRSSNGTVTTAASAVSLVTGNWYELSYSVERTSTSGQFNASVAVYNSSNAGVQGSMVDSLSGTFTNATLWADSSVFAAIRENTSIVNLDNFAAQQGVAAVPEPASCAAMAGVVLLGFAAGRRRRGGR